MAERPSEEPHASHRGHRAGEPLLARERRTGVNSAPLARRANPLVRVLQHGRDAAPEVGDASWIADPDPGRFAAVQAFQRAIQLGLGNRSHAVQNKGWGWNGIMKPGRGAVGAARESPHEENR